MSESLQDKLRRFADYADQPGNELNAPALSSAEVRRIADTLDRVAELERAIEDAPHDVMCESVDHDGEPIFFPCTCWKARASRKG